MSAVATGSRAMNVTADMAEVRALCEKQGLTISAIETLLSGGTRVVMQCGADADHLRKAMKRKLITGSVSRAAWASLRAV